MPPSLGARQKAASVNPVIREATARLEPVWCSTESKVLSQKGLVVGLERAGWRAERCDPGRRPIPSTLVGEVEEEHDCQGGGQG